MSEQGCNDNNQTSFRGFWLLSCLLFGLISTIFNNNSLAQSTKKQADLIVYGEYVVTMREDQQVIKDGAVAILNNKILAVASRTEILNAYFSNQQIADKLEELGADATALRESEKGDWQILFADKRPIQVEFDNHGFAIAITGAQFRQGRNRIRNGLRIRLKFKINRVDGQLILARDGKAEVEYMGDKDGITVAFKNALEKQLN
ncbi:MAG: hypothetical protein COA74_12575, partial [Gammaproteobacteria bacterium]